MNNTTTINNPYRYTEYRISKVIWNTTPPILLIVGTLGNVMTILVLMQRRNRNISTAIYLTALAMSDMFLLLSGLLPDWLYKAYAIDIALLSEVTCRSIYFISTVVAYCSSWLVVALTSERVVAVWLPFRAKGMCTPGTAFKVIIAMVLVSCLANSHFLHGMGLNEEQICLPIGEQYVMFMSDIWPHIDAHLYYIIPSLVLLIGNTTVIVGVLRRRIATSSTGGNKGIQLTVMVITVNVVFLMCTTPFTIYLFVYSEWIARSDMHGGHETAVHDLWLSIVTMLMYLNNAVNFILYFLSGERFRQEAKRAASNLFIGPLCSLNRVRADDQET